MRGVRQGVADFGQPLPALLRLNVQALQRGGEAAFELAMLVHQ
jgi:hypothetical protein